MANVSIDYDLIASQLTDGIYSIQASDSQFRDFKITVTQERQFIERKANQPNSIFIVVSFGEATIDYGQSLIPLTLDVYGEERTFTAARALLNAFATKYNLYRKGEIVQLWNAPTMVSPFNPTGTNFRALFALTGVIVYSGENGNPIVQFEYVEGSNSEKLELLTFNDTLSNSLRPQPFSDGVGRTRSVSAYVTYTIGFSLYVKHGSGFFDKVNAVKYKKMNGDTPFHFVFTHLDGMQYEGDMKLLAYNGAQSTGTQYTANLTFTE